MQLNHNDGLQTWYTSRMQAAGYAVKQRGCCFGIAHMAMQAFLVNQMPEFNERLDRLKQRPLEYFENDFLLPHQQVDDLRKAGKDDAAADIIREIVDFRGFFDGVILYQYPTEYPELITNLDRLQDAEKSLPLVQSIDLERSSGPAHLDELTCLFTQGALADFFEILRGNLENNSFSTILNTGRHAVNINYDANTKRWIWVDANHLPPQEFEQTEALIEALSDLFTEKLCSQMSIDVYASGQAVETQAAYQLLKNQPAYQRACGQSTLEKLLTFNELPPQSGYEIQNYLAHSFHKKLLSLDELTTSFKQVFSKVSPDAVLEYVCSDYSPSVQGDVEFLMDFHQAKPSLYAMRTAELSVFEAMLERIKKFELGEQEAFFTNIVDGESILTAVIFSAEKVSLVLNHLAQFSPKVWERILIPENRGRLNPLQIITIHQPQFVAQLLDIIDNFSWSKQKSMIEPVIKMLRHRKDKDDGPILTLLCDRLHAMRMKAPWKERTIADKLKTMANFRSLKTEIQKESGELHEEDAKSSPKLFK